MRTNVPVKNTNGIELIKTGGKTAETAVELKTNLRVLMIHCEDNSYLKISYLETCRNQRSSYCGFIFLFS